MGKFSQFLTELSARNTSVFSFPDDNFSILNISGFSPNFVCALILWRCGLRLMMGKFRPFLTELSAHKTSVFYFQDYNFE